MAHEARDNLRNSSETTGKAKADRFFGTSTFFIWGGNLNWDTKGWR